MFLKLALNYETFKLGASQPIGWDTEQARHMLIIGNTGSGKTFLSKSVIGKIALHNPHAKLTVCDFKGEDFSFLTGCDRYYHYEDCLIGLRTFYNDFERRQKGQDNSRENLVLYFDEWAAFLNHLTSSDKKLADEAKRLQSNLLMLSRAYGVNLICSLQRPDVVFVSSRDNFNVIVALGNLSEEGKNMLFHEYKNQLLNDRLQGTGYMLTNGTNLTSIIVPAIANVNMLHETIKSGVIR